MVTIEEMADAIAKSEGKLLDEVSRKRLYDRMVQLGHNSLDHLEGRYDTLSKSKEQLHVKLTREKFQR